MDELTREQEEATAATVGCIQRLAMAVVAVPKEQRAAHYAFIRKKFEAAIKERLDADIADPWLDKTMKGLQGLVTEIEAGGGAAGGRA